ncbi:MAG: hypothetical protein ACREAQ_08460 [Nitrososphaera sp.]
MSPKNRLVIVAVAATATVAAIVVALSVLYGGETDDGAANRGTGFASNIAGTGVISIVTISGGQLAGGAVYRIAPDPFSGSGNFTIRDGDITGDLNQAPGITTIGGLPDGTFVVTQAAAPEGHARDFIPKMVTIANRSAEAVAFITDGSGESAQSTDGSGSSTIESIVYTTKFECGTIRGNEGPLRPGHYDTDIGIFNKQGFPVTANWIAAPDGGRSSNAILRTLEPATSTSIVCRDLRSLLAEDPNGFVEGFVIIEVPLDSMLLGSISAGGLAVIGSNEQDRIDVLDVQVFYTANALEELPREIIVDKITFAIVSDPSGKIPAPMVDKTLDVTVPSSINVISDPEAEVKIILDLEYNMTEQELSDLEIEIKSVDVGMSTTIDDHAISLTRVRPQARSN